MKRLLFAVLCLLTVSFAKAQDMKFGVRGGFFASNYNHAATAGNNPGSFYFNDYSGDKFGIYAGATLDMSLVDAFRIQPEFNVSFVPDNNYGYIAVSVPVMVKYSFFDKFYAMAGPALNFAVDADSDQFSPSFNLGASYDLMEDFYVELRGDIGITGYLGHNINAGVGYRF